MTKQKVGTGTGTGSAKARPRVRTTKRARQDEPITAGGDGATWLWSLGWLLTVAGAVGFGLVVGPRWSATVGDGFTYVVAGSPTSTSTLASAIAVVGPLLGFNAIYFGQAQRHRRRAMLVFVALVGAELLALVLAAMWMVGAGRHASDTVGGAAFVRTLFVLACTAAAAAIMGWLGGNSTFDRQSEEYFAKRQATVEVTPIGLPARICWVLGSALLLVVLAVGPAHLAVDHVNERYSSGPRRPWPQPWMSDGGFATAVGLVSIVLGLVLGVCVSMLVKALLYRTPWAAGMTRPARRSPPSFGLRALRLTHHWPIAVAGMWWSVWLTWGVAENDTGAFTGGIGVPLWLGFAPLALGLLLLSQVWRVQDQTVAARPLRLKMGGLPH